MNTPGSYIYAVSDETEAAWRAWQSLLARLAEVVARSGDEAWIVGGCLRDVVSAAYRPAAPGSRPRPIHTVIWRDVDVAVRGDPVALARALASDLRAAAKTSGTPTIEAGSLASPAQPTVDVKQRGVAIAQLHEGTTRLYVGTPMLPFQAQLDLSRLDGATIQDDLARRDFRVNALALPLTTFLRRPSSHTSPTNETGADDANTSDASGAAGVAKSAFSPDDLIDPFGGVDDLRIRRLQVVSPRSLTDDPGRILRGARLRTALALATTEGTAKLARQAAPLLLTLPADRVRDELRAIMAQPRAHESLAFLAAVGAFQTLLPALWAELADGAGANLTSGGWWLALVAMSHADSPVALFGEARIPASERLATDPVSLLDAWYASPLADGAPRSLALRWGLLLFAAPMWRAFVASHGDGPAGAQSPEAPAASAQLLTGTEARLATRLSELARTLPITREERRLAETIALATPQAMRLLALETAPDNEALLDAVETRRYFAAYDMAGIDALTASLAMARAYAHRFVEPGPTVGRVTLDAATLDRMAERARKLAAAYLATPERIVPPPLLDGATVIRELGVSPGPLVGQALAAIRAAQIEWRVTSRAEALAFGSDFLRQREMTPNDDAKPSL